MITSKLASKAQAAMPQAVRLALHVAEGDGRADAIENDRGVLTRAPSTVGNDPSAPFHEWDGEADRRACADL